MTAPYGQPANVAGEGSRVGVQALHADIDTVIIPGDVQLTVGQDASPAAKYRAGIENLNSGNPRTARGLIWAAMMSDHVNTEMLFHWLVAMLSGRTVRQFSKEEIDQLKHSRSRYAEAGGDAWADGVRLIYRLLDSVLLRSTVIEAERRAVKTDMSFLVKQFDNLQEKQRDMVRPHLELFLIGPRQDEMWQRELKIAQSSQHSGGRLGRAWMFFQPVPARVLLPSPWPERVSRADRVAMRVSGWLFAAAAGYLGWELVWHHAFLGLLGYAAALAGGAAAVVADLEWRFLAERRSLKDRKVGVSNQSVPSSSGDELADGIDKLFSRYFARYALDQAERKRWEAATVGLRRFHRGEIIEVCRSSGIPANEVAWLIRYEVRQMKQRWHNGTLHECQKDLAPRPGTVAARRLGLAVLVLGGIWIVVELRAHPLADVVALPSALCAIGVWWRCWLHVKLERRRYAADSEEHAQRQEPIDKEFKRWSEKLGARPKDADMAAWLGSDRTVLLGGALDHFHLSRSRLIAHAFLEEPGAAVRRARIEGGPLRYAMYRLLVFLLAEDGVRQVRANLDFITGTLTIRERTSYRYEAIVSARFLQEARRQTFELRLTAGEPITVRVRNTNPRDAQQDQDLGPAEEPPEAEEDTTQDVTSVADLLHALEGVAGEGPNWLRGRDWAGAWSGEDHANRSEEGA